MRIINSLRRFSIEFSVWVIVLKKFRTLFQAVAYSLLFHAIVIIIFVILRVQSRPTSEVEIAFQMPKQEAPQVTAPKPIVTHPRPTTENKHAGVHIPRLEPEIAAADTMVADTMKKFDRLTFFASSPTLTFQRQLLKTETDSAETLTTAQPSLPLFNKKDSIQFSVLPGPYGDRIQRDIDQQNLGHPRPLPLTDVANEGAKYISDLFNKKKEKPVRLDFVPSDVELDILQTLWNNSQATDVEIYTALDSSFRVTAADLNEIMTKLADKGLLKRKLVSPRNEFTFPLGAVEMSAKNRRNRVYLYESRINSDEVLRYLQAVLYEVEYGEQSTSSDTARSSQIASLKAKILRLIASRG